MIDFTANVWEKRYQEGETPWDLGFPAPPLINLLASIQAPKVGRTAVLGCGTGQDAILFATAGFDVVGFDIAPSAIKRAKFIAKTRELNIQFFNRNIFELEAEFFNSFDYVLEHTFFCTLDIPVRPQYVQIVKRLLCQNGQLIALFYTNFSRVNKPPFGIKPKELLTLFTPHFDVRVLKATTDSIPQRKGKEHLGIFQVRSA